MAAAKRKASTRATGKKAPAKAKKAPAKRAGAAKSRKASPKKVEAYKSAKISVPSKAYTQSELMQTLADTTGVGRKDVKNLFEQLRAIIEAHLNRNGPGSFTLPGLAKMTLHTKPATKARRGINPFTGEEMMFKAKPARKVVKIRALKKLKGLI